MNVIEKMFDVNMSFAVEVTNYDKGEFEKCLRKVRCSKVERLSESSIICLRMKTNQFYKLVQLLEKLGITLKPRSIVGYLYKTEYTNGLRVIEV